MVIRTYSSESAASATDYSKQKKPSIPLGTRALDMPNNGTTSNSTSPQLRRTRAVASRQRRLTDSMVLDEASDTYLKAFTEQVSRLKTLTDGLQRLEPSSVENRRNQNDPMDLQYVPAGQGDGKRSNWPALSNSLASGYRIRSSSSSAVMNRPRLVQAAAQASSTQNSTSSKNGDALHAANENMHWQRQAEISSMPRSSIAIQHHHHQHHQSQNTTSTLPNAQNSSFYETTGGNEDANYSQHRQFGNGAIGEFISRENERRSLAAPLAKPEPLADFEKPAFDNRQSTKQAATGTRFGNVQYAQHNHNHVSQSYQQQHQKTIRFADEDEDENDHMIRAHRDEDPGIMSEAETSATLGSNSSVRRRQIAQLKKHSDRTQWSQDSNSAIRLGDISPRLQRPSESARIAITPAPVVNAESKTGVVFLQYQGETKRSVLPVGYDGTPRTALHSMDDVRILFLKSFQSEISPEYLQSQMVKIYIQDPSKTDVFYELDDLNDVKDRSVLKLHECPRPNSPSPVIACASIPVQNQSQQQSMLSPPQENRPIRSPQLERASVADPNLSARSSPRQQLASELRSKAFTHYHQSSSMSDDMNYFSEPEFDANGDYRLRKSSSTSNYCVSPVFPAQHATDQRRHYGTIDRFYGTGSANVGRSSYRAQQQVPPKPERHFGPGIPSGGRASMRRSQSPPRPAVLPGIRPFGHSTDPEETYGVRGSNGAGAYGDYAPSPTSDMLLESLYNRPPSVNRSGSVTPVIDEEARIRMINMEKQLANLSTLVHSALMSKGVNETVYKDLESLRREILGTNGAGGSQQSTNGCTSTRDDLSESGSISRFSDVSSEKGSFQNAERDGTYAPTVPFTSISADASSNQHMTNGSANGHVTPELRHTLRNCKRRVGEIQSDLKNLRRLAQLNAQSSRDILKDAFDRIKVILNTNKHLHMFAAQAQQQNQVAANGLSTDRNWADQEQERYRKSMQRVEKELADLEKHVEGMRQKVISGERKLRMTEVEQFTESLGQIGRLAAHLKTNFPMLQDRLKQVMSSEMEKVVREEKFLKDEPSRVDTALKRCKKLTNTMVTMKKLAMVQDPAAYYGSSNRTQSPVKQAGSMENEVSQNGTPNAPVPDYKRNVSPLKEDAPSKSSNVAVVAPSPASKSAPGGHVLDSLLEELQNVAKTTSPDGVAESNESRVKHEMAEKNGEKKVVGFVDQVQVLTREPDGVDSDTIKRAPKLNGNGYTNGNYGRYSPQVDVGNGSLMNSILSRQHSGGMNGNYVSYAPMGARRRSASPLLTGSVPIALSNASSFMHNSGVRSHSGTPSSVTSDPMAYQYHHVQAPPPPPPPRSSSRSMLTSSGQNSDQRLRNFDIDELKQQLIRSSSPANKGQMMLVTATPAAIVQTNAVDEEPRLVKSASSSESVNSQDGRNQRHRVVAFADDGKEEQLMTPPGKPPPPPPPPRNKQEMLEQRQHELLAKQMQNRYRHQL